tara:strand:- start:26644 stop:27075 length:432 start_codon:yes stop_codon:yes gene_type:complete
MMTEYTISKVDVEDLQEVMPHVQEWLEDALSIQQDVTMDDVVMSIILEKAWLFMIHDDEEVVGTFVSSIENHPQNSYLCIDLLGGIDYKAWGDKVRSEMRRLAKAAGLSGLVIHGRKGWAKAFPDLKVEYITMIDRIGEEDGR